MNVDGDVTTLIWDFDGTIINSIGILEEVLAAILPAYGREMPSHETVLANCYASLEDSINNILGGIPPEELEAIVQNFLFVQEQHYEVVGHHIFADALDLLRQARRAGLRQILVTNREHRGGILASPRSIVARSVLKNYIDDIICGDDTEHRKPNPEVLGDVLGPRGTKPDEIIIVGDQFVDGLFAQNLGCRAVLVPHNSLHINHLDRLDDDWQSYVTVVQSLSDVKISKAKTTAKSLPRKSMNAMLMVE